MHLSPTDEIEVFKSCLACGGIPFVPDVAGKTKCKICGGKGEQSERIMLSDFVEYLGEELAKAVRLHTGIRSYSNSQKD